MATLEVICASTSDNKHRTSHVLNHVSHFDCLSVTSSFAKIKEQEQSYGDGRILMLRAPDSTASEYEHITWTRICAVCYDRYKTSTYQCYLFIEQHPCMAHTVSFMYT